LIARRKGEYGAGARHLRPIHPACPRFSRQVPLIVCAHRLRAHRARASWSRARLPLDRYGCPMPGRRRRTSPPGVIHALPLLSPAFPDQSASTRHLTEKGPLRKARARLGAKSLTTSASASASGSHCAAVRPRRLLGGPDTMQRRKPLLKMGSMEVAVGFAGLERNRSHAAGPSIPRLSAAPSGEPAAPGGRIRCPAKAGPMEALRWLGGARRLQERRDRQAAAARRGQVGAQQLRERSGAARHFSLGEAG
jgi:hypothetical protein